MRAIRTVILVVLAAAAAPASSPAALPAQSLAFVGDEFQVNTYTTDGQARVAIATEDDGDFVVVWESQDGQDGAQQGVFGRRFASSGAALGVELQINVYTLTHQWAPAVAMDADGDFVVVWHSAQGQDGSGYGNFGRRYTSAGTALGGEFLINTVTLGTQSYATVGMDDSGRFLVTWQSDTQDGDQFGIHGQRYASDGSPIGAELLINTVTTNNQVLPAVGVSDSGAAVVVWESIAQDGSQFGVFGRRFDSSGVPLATDFQVNVYTTGDQRGARVGVADDGSFVVTWHSGHDGSQTGIFARRFDSAGGGGLEFQVNANTASFQRSPSIAVAGNGGFVVAWASFDLYGGGYGVFARRFNAAGGTSGTDVQVDTYFTSDQDLPAIAGRDNGAVVLAWQSSDQDGSDTGVFARRTAASILFDVDGDSMVTPLTDGLLIVRRLFGFSGATLISSAVGGGCTRCMASEIASYIDGLDAELDVDGNGALGALTDGILVLRYSFGFRGATLELGAVGDGCIRCTAPNIEPYIAARI